MSQETTPQDVQVSLSEQTLTIVWADGHESIFMLESLRRACPCVACKGGHANMGKPVNPIVFREIPQRTWHVAELKAAGNYGLQIVWGDGHREGIYGWEHLRAWDEYL